MFIDIQWIYFDWFSWFFKDSGRVSGDARWAAALGPHCQLPQPQGDAEDLTSLWRWVSEEPRAGADCLRRRERCRASFLWSPFECPLKCLFDITFMFITIIIILLLYILTIYPLLLLFVELLFCFWTHFLCIPGAWSTSSGSAFREPVFVDLEVNRCLAAMKKAGKPHVKALFPSDLFMESFP